MKIRFKKVRENAVLPYRATEMSGGLDVTASKIEVISDQEVLVYLGLAMQPVSDEMIMKNYRIRFSPRSSFTKYNWYIPNSPCLGDADFTGEYRIRFRAIPTGFMSGSGVIGPGFTPDTLLYDDFPYKVGDRVAQMWVEEIIPIEFEEGELINHTDRKGGFGSTGK